MSLCPVPRTAQKPAQCWSHAWPLCSDSSRCSGFSSRCSGFSMRPEKQAPPKGSCVAKQGPLGPCSMACSCDGQADSTGFTNPGWNAHVVMQGVGGSWIAALLTILTPLSTWGGFLQPFASSYTEHVCCRLWSNDLRFMGRSRGQVSCTGGCWW